MFENLYFDSLNADYYGTINCYTLIDRIKTSINFTKYGTFNNHAGAKCVIFPKGKTTWEGFQRPFKDGDILATDLGSVFYLNTRLNTDKCYGCFVGKGGDGSFHICEPFAYKECCGLATEEEKAKLFQAIKDNGYKWNAEAKTLEKLQRKFDITSLKPFDKVLVRDNNGQLWTADMFSFYSEGGVYPYMCVGHYVNQCIPYDQNKHLLGTTDDCDEYFKTWK